MMNNELNKYETNDTIWKYTISIMNDNSKYVFFSYNITDSNINIDTKNGIVTICNPKKNTFDWYPLCNIKYIKKEPYVNKETDKKGDSR